MWLVEEFAAFHAQSIEAAQKNISGTSAPADSTTAPAPSKIILWDFRTHSVLIGKFIGAGVEISLTGTELKIGTFGFDIGDGKIFYVPAWPALDVPALNFSGFSKENPDDGSMYMLQYFGMDENKKIQIKIFKK